MDWTALGIDALLIAGVIAGAKLITSLADPEKKLERWYPVLPVLLAVPVAILRHWGAPWYVVAFNAIIYGFIAGHTYKTGKTTVLGQ